MASSEFVQKIKTELIEKSYFNDIKYNIKSRSRWKIIGDICETLAYLCMGLSGIFAFAAGFFEQRVLSFVAGCLSIAAPLFLKYSSRAMAESTERTNEVNLLLKALGIDEIPDIVIDSAGSNHPIANRDFVVDINDKEPI